MTIIRIKRTTVAGSVPTLEDGEVALNLTDSRFFFKNTAGTVKFLDFTSDAEKVASGPIKVALDTKANSNNAVAYTDRLSADDRSLVLSRDGNGNRTDSLGNKIPVLYGLDMYSAGPNQAPETGPQAVPRFNWWSREAFQPGNGNFYIQAAWQHTVSSNNGHRETFHINQRANSAASGQYRVAANFQASAMPGSSGNIFGFNSYAIGMPGALTSTELASYEANTIALTNVTRKVGIQIVDSSIGAGTGNIYDAGLLFGAFSDSIEPTTGQVYEGGYTNAIQVGLGFKGNGADLGVKPNGCVLFMAGSTRQIRAGIDFSNGVFGQSPFIAPVRSAMLKAGQDGAGGTIRSDTDGNGFKQIFLSNNLTFQSAAGTNIVEIDAVSNAFKPGGDGLVSLGQPTNRWNTLFASTGTINTSDEKFKTNISLVDDDLLDAISTVDVKIFQYISSVEEKGSNARYHTGVIAQEVASALENKGLNPGKYAFWCEDPILEEVEEIVEVDEEIFTEVAYEELELTKNEEGNYIYKTVAKYKKEFDMESFPVYNEDGSPHITVGSPARYSKDNAGNNTVLIPATETKQTVITKPRTRKVQKLIKTTKEKIDENGKIVTQLGIRYSDLSMLLFAYVSREMKKIKKDLY